MHDGGSWLATLCKTRVVADLVESNASFDAWYERLKTVGTVSRPDYTFFRIDQRDYIVRALLVGLERTAKTLGDWNKLHELSYPSKMSKRAEQALANFLLQT